MKFVPNFVRQIIWKFKCFALTKRACVRNWLNAKHFFLFELLTLRAVLLSNKLVRQYIVLKGKDPDYVATPPPPPPIPDTSFEDTCHKHGIFTTRNKSPSIDFGWGNTMVKNLSAHPVLKLRATQESLYSRALPVIERIEEPLQVTSPTFDQVVEEIKLEVSNIEVSNVEKTEE